MKSLKSLTKKQKISMCSVAGLIIIWQLLCTIIGEDSTIPSPIAILVEIVDMCVNGFAKYSLFTHAFFSAKRVLVAFVIGGALGILLGIGMGWNRVIRAIFYPIFSIFRCIPPIAWIPLLIMWFGIGEVSKTVICFLGTFIPVTINSFNGIKSVEPMYLESVDVLGGKSMDMVKSVVIPSALPAIFAGLQNGMSTSWVTVLAAEMTSSTEGLGYIIIKGMERNDTTIIFAGMVTIALVGMTCAAAVRLVERKVCKW